MPKQLSFTSSNPKMGSIPSYEKGGLVIVVAAEPKNAASAPKTKSKDRDIYTADKGPPPKNPDMGSSPPPVSKK